MKRALGEFARPCPTGSELEASLDELLDDHRATMALQLDHMLARIRKRPGKEQRDSDVDRIAVAIEEAGQGGVARDRQFADQCRRDLRRLRPGDAHDPDAAASGR